MSCGTFQMDIDQGADLLITVTRTLLDGTPVDISGATFVGQIRPAAGSSEEIQALTIAVVDGPNGVYQISLTAAQTAALPVIPNVGYQNVPTLWAFDIRMTLAGVTTRVLQGPVSVSPQVTP